MLFFSIQASQQNASITVGGRGSRRFLVAEVVSIDLDANVDLNQVYAQVE